MHTHNVVIIFAYSITRTHTAVCLSILYKGSFVYSEENVWKLCEQVKRTRPEELSKCYAVFVSNEGRTVPLWRQKAGRGDDQVVIWVIRLAKPCIYVYKLHANTSFY